MKVPQTPAGSTLERALLALEKMEGKLAAVERAQFEPLAIVGMACRLPGGVANPNDLWQLLHAGTDAVTEVSAHRRKGDTTPISAARWAGLLNEVDQFDGDFFGINRNEVADMDPQHRMLLEVAWEAIEDAGIPHERLVDTKTGVFVGISSKDYLDLVNAAGVATALRPYIATGNAAPLAAGRISYLLGLRGPCLCVDTACSSVLVALHLACQSLRRGECDMALVGGVNLILSPGVSNALAGLQVLSPDGRCRTFDARANGYVRAEGAGMLVLKRMSDAERQVDRIWALVRGAAINQNGRSASLTAPNLQAQAAVIQSAITNARAKPEQIGYVEVHSNGSPFGDPVELDALRAAIGKPRPNGNSCVLGSVKTFIGHAELASGIASLIKTALVLNHEVIPRNLHFESLNPNASLEGTPFVIPAHELPWKRTAERRLAGVSGTSLGGANAHVILEEPPIVIDDSDKPQRPFHLFVLSGKTVGGLRDRARQMLRHLEANSDESLGDQCHTLAAGRSHFEHRFAVVVTSTSDVLGQLTDFIDGAPSAYLTGRVENLSARRRVAAIFKGTGVQVHGVLGAMHTVPAPFLEALQNADNALLALLGRGILHLLESDNRSELPNDAIDEELALFVLQYALVELWRSWGIEPAAFVGSGMGECVAAWAAGALEFADALALAIARARFVKSNGRDADELSRTLSRLTLATPKSGFFTSLGGSHSITSLGTLAYWQVQRTTVVDFAPIFSQLSSRDFDACIEIGPCTDTSSKPSAAYDALPVLPTVQRGMPILRSLIDVAARLYIRGFAVNWDGFNAAYGYRRISLPFYPFQRQRHWFSGATSAESEVVPDGHPLLGRALEPRADRPDVRVWDTVFNGAHYQAIGVQQILGTSVLSSGGMVQIACAAAREIFGDVAWEISLRLSDPPAIHEDTPLTMQVIASPENESKMGIGIYFRVRSSAQWKPFALGTVQLVQQSEDDEFSAPPSMRPGRRQVVAQALWEGRLEAFGIDTEAMRIDQMWRRDGETLAGVVLVKGQAALSFARAAVAIASITHPALHGCWWMIESVEGLTTKVVTSNNRCWLRLNWTANNGTTARLSAELIDEEGIVAASARNITLRAQDPSAVLRGAGKDPLENAFIDILWKESAIVPSVSSVKRKWIVLTDFAGVGVALAIQLQASGDTVITLPAAALEQRIEMLDMVLSVSGPFYGVVHLGAIDAPTKSVLSFDDIDEGIRKSTILAQRIIERLVAQSEVPRLWLVTRGAQPIGDGDTGQSAAQAGLWGLGRVLSIERSDMWGGLIDLDPRVRTDDSTHLVQALVAMGGEDHVVLRGGKFYVARLARVSIAEQLPLEVRSDRTYLVTGARTPLGAAVVQWLADRGARSFILIHRDANTTASPVATWQNDAHVGTLVQSLRGRGIEVIESDADVSKVNEVSDLLLQSGVQVGGIVHTTGVLDDSIGRLTGQHAGSSLESSVFIKYHALLALHLATVAAESPLDFFVSFGSVPAWLGWEGLGADSVALEVSEGIMRNRRQNGLPATSLRLALANGSRGESVTLDTEVLAAGFQGMPTSYSLQAIEKAIAHGQAAVTATWADWDLFEHAQRARGSRPLFAGMTAGRRVRTGAATLQRRISSSEPEQAQRMVESIVRSDVARVLGVNSSDIISDQHELSVLGMDSIMIVHVLSSINSTFGVTLPTELILKRPTIESLSTRIIQTLQMSQLALFNQSGLESRKGLLIELNRGTTKKLPFFFAPPSVGTGIVFRALVDLMSKDRPFYTFSAPGVDSDEQPCERVEVLAARFLEAMRQVQPRGPYRLGGYSLGALVAYEMAQILMRSGEQVDILVLTDLPPSRFSRSDPSLLGHLAEIVAPLEIDVSAFLALGPDEQAAHMAIALGKLVSLPADVAQSGRLLSVYRAHLTAAIHYCPMFYDGKMAVIGAQDTLASLNRMGYLAGDPTIGWSHLCRHPVATYDIPGNHINIVAEPYVIQFARVLQSILDGVDAS